MSKCWAQTILIFWKTRPDSQELIDSGFRGDLYAQGSGVSLEKVDLSQFGFGSSYRGLLLMGSPEQYVREATRQVVEYLSVYGTTAELRRIEFFEYKL